MAAQTLNPQWSILKGVRTTAHPVTWVQDLDIWLCSKCGKRIIPPFDRNHYGNPHQIRQSMGKKSFIFETNPSIRCFDDGNKRAVVNYNVKDVYSIKQDKVFKSSSEVCRVTYNRKTKRLFWRRKLFKNSRGWIVRDITYHSDRIEMVKEIGLSTNQIMAKGSTNVEKILDRLDSMCTGGLTTFYSMAKSMIAKRANGSNDIRTALKLSNEHYDALMKEDRNSLVFRLICGGWNSIDIYEIFKRVFPCNHEAFQPTIINKDRVLDLLKGDKQDIYTLVGKDIARKDPMLPALTANAMNMALRMREYIKDKPFRLKFNTKDVLPNIKNATYYINEIDTFGNTGTQIIDMIYPSFRKEAIKIKNRIIFYNKSVSISADNFDDLSKENEVVLSTLINGEFTRQKFSVCDPHKFENMLKTIKNILAS